MRTSSTYKSSHSTYIVLNRSVSKLVCEDLQDFSVSPSFLAICVVGIVVWCDPAKAIFEVIWSWPRIAGCNHHRGRRWQVVWRTWLWTWHFMIDDGEGKLSSRDAPSREEELEDF